jgi:type II secretion system protein G
MEGENFMKKRKGFTLIELMIVIAIIAILAAILVPNFLRARAQGQFTACQSNCKNIGTALEMYSTDNSGHYPTAMTGLTPNYMQNLPSCQSAGSITYSSAYSAASIPDAYTFYCKGSNHKTLQQGEYPQYNSTQGLRTGKN